MNQQPNKIKFYQYHDKYNVGDCLSEPILKHFLGDEIEQVKANEKGKLVAVGSVMSKVQDGDVVWGTGCMSPKQYPLKATILAVRGKLSRERITGVEIPEVYGDPALLLPLIYNPKIEKKYQIGFVPHYVDKKRFEGSNFIDVALPWKEFVDRILECRSIVSSSLHGIVIAEAYGIPATWEVYSDKVIGKGFKFRDYLTGTGREIQGPGRFPPIKNLEEIQTKLINSLKKHYGKI
jgi:hypothetical protein